MVVQKRRDFWNLKNAQNRGNNWILGGTNRGRGYPHAPDRARGR